MQAILLGCAVWLAAALSAVAQEDDKGFLTRTLQDVLSGAGRAVEIDGFRGALSSQASFDRMTIADDEGVWLTLEGAQLDWTRAALLRGRLEVERLTAERLTIARAPVPSGDALPEAEAGPFRLPDLPVSIDIADFGVAEINLGAPLLGEEVRLTVEAAARLTGDVADIDLTARRTDAKRGSLSLIANFARSSEQLELNLSLAEGRDGIAARLLNLPDRPSVDLSVAGAGPLDDYVAEIGLRTEGQERLAGQVALADAGADGPGRVIRADLGGDITALMAPRYRAFFGEEVRLTLDALVEDAGPVTVRDFALDAQAVALAGQLGMDTSGWPVLIDVTGRIANPDGTGTLLPLGGDAKTVQTVDLRVDYDADDGDAVVADFRIDGLSTAQAEVAQAALALRGQLTSAERSVGAFSGDVAFDLTGLALTDAALAEAVGDAVTARAQIDYAEGAPLEVRGLDVTGADYGLVGSAVIGALETGLSTALDATLSAQDLSRFSGVAGQSLSGAAELALRGDVVPLSGQFDLEIAGQTDDLALGIAQADAVLAGRTGLSLGAARGETGTVLRDLVLRNAAIDLTGSAELRSEDSRAEATFTLADVGLVVPQYEGPVSVVARADQSAAGWRVDARTQGPYEAALTARGLATGPSARLNFTADVPEVSRFTPELTGPLTAEGVLARVGEGWEAQAAATGPFGARAEIDGLVAPRVAVDFDLSLPDVAPLAPGFTGPVRAQGALEQRNEGYFIDARATGPFDARVGARGQLAPALGLDLDVSVPDVRPLAPQIGGPLSAAARVEQRDAGIFVRAGLSGPIGARAAVEGIATGANLRLDFDLDVPNVRPVAPGISGPLSARGGLRQTPQGLAVETTASGPFSSRAAVEGVVTGPQADVSFDVSMPNLAALVEKLNGPLRVEGRAQRAGSAWRINTEADGPGGTQATVAGQVNGDGTLALDIAGNAPLGLARPFLAPRDLQGPAQFDLRLNGRPSLGALSGRITTQGASFTAPNTRLALQGIAGSVDLADNRATIDLTGQGTNGGTLRAGGSVTLTPSYPGDLQISLNDIVVIDPRLYRTVVDAALRIAGPLTGGARISGQVDVGETQVSVPSTGLTSIGEIPPIAHVGATRPVMSSRRRAALETAAADRDGVERDAQAFGLDVQVNALNRIFVRGRGLDAELGGALRVSGTTRRIISAGRFDLLRGRLDILGKRFDLREGSARFQGDLLPYIRFVSATETSTGEVRVVIEGPADEPEISFEATPAAPEDEVLAQLLFGRNISEISPLQALQLANAVATLAGRGGVSVISNLRQGFGLDDLDLTTNEDGTTAVRAGRYISENVYTDVTAASDGTGEVSINIDITPNLTGKATLGSDGDSGIGIFFERDY